MNVTLHLVLTAELVWIARTASSVTVLAASTTTCALRQLTNATVYLVRMEEHASMALTGQNTAWWCNG